MFTAALALGLALSLPPDGSFKSYHEEDGVKVEIAERPNEIAWIRGTGEVAAPYDKVAAALTDFASYEALLGDMVKKATVLEKLPDGARIHFVYPYPWPLRNRDAVVTYRVEKPASGKLRVWWHHDARPGDPKEGTRIERVEGETRVERLAADKTKLVYTYLGDLGGDFGKSVREKAYRKEAPHYFNSLRKALAPPAK